MSPRYLRQGKLPMRQITPEHDKQARAPNTRDFYDAELQQKNGDL